MVSLWFDPVALRATFLFASALAASFAGGSSPSSLCALVQLLSVVALNALAAELYTRGFLVKVETPSTAFDSGVYILNVHWGGASVSRLPLLRRRSRLADLKLYFLLSVLFLVLSTTALRSVRFSHCE